MPCPPEKPHHPAKGFVFPKRSFGKSKPVLCSAQSQWFEGKAWPFLHYDEAQDVVFCHNCVTAFKLNQMISSRNAAPAFVSCFTAVNMILYADIWQYGGCLSFGLICHGYNRDFFTGCEVKAEASTRVWVELGGSVHHPLVKLLLLRLYELGNPRRYPA